MSKRRGNGEGSIFQRADGRWTATISIGFGETGKRRRRTVYAATKREVREKLLELHLQQSAGTLRPVDRETLAEFLNHWLDTSIRPERSENTTDAYERTIRNHIVPYLGSVRLDRIDAATIQRLLSELQTRSIGPSARRRVYEILSSSLNRGVRWGKIRFNPCDFVDKPRTVRKEMQPLSAEEARHLLNTTREHRLYALMVLAISTGMRQGELFGLGWDAVDLDRGILHVRRQLTNVKGKPKLTRPKTPKSRRLIELTDDAVEALMEHRALMLREGYGGSEVVFCGANGGYIQRASFARNFWHRSLDKAGIERRGFHHLRHTYATLTLGAGVPVHIVSAVLGHARPSITLDVYSHVLEGMQSQARDSIGLILRAGSAVSAASA
jgi:integrase